MSVDPEEVLGPDEDAVGRCVDAHDVAGLGVQRGPLQTEPASLPDGEAVGARWVPTTSPLAASTISPGCSPSRAVSQPRVSPSGMKQMS